MIARLLGKVTGFVVGVIGTARIIGDELRRGGLDNLDKNLNDRAASEATELMARAVGAPTVRFESGKVKVGA